MLFFTRPQNTVYINLAIQTVLYGHDHFKITDENLHLIEVEELKEKHILLCCILSHTTEMITTKAKGALSYLELLSKSNNIEALIPLIKARIFNGFAEKN